MRLLISKNPSDLVGEIIAARTYSIDNSRKPSFYLKYDEMWESLRQSLIHLAPKLRGNATQLEEMRQQAKAHFEAGHAPGGDDWEITLGARLMQDMEALVKGRRPFAYPVDLYRWPRPAIN